MSRRTWFYLKSTQHLQLHWINLSLCSPLATSGGKKTLFIDSWFRELTPLYLVFITNKNGLETPSLISLDVLPY